MSNIYFIKAEQYVKVGYTKDVQKRMAQLQVANPHELTLLASINGTHELERRFHQCLKPYKVRGEWYRLEAEICTLVSMVVNGARPDSVSQLRALLHLDPGTAWLHRPTKTGALPDADTIAERTTALFHMKRRKGKSLTLRW